MCLMYRHIIIVCFFIMYYRYINIDIMINRYDLDIVRYTIYTPIKNQLSVELTGSL